MSENLLLLVDVEGWEEHVLAGASGPLALDPKPVWIIEILPDTVVKRTRQTQVFQKMFTQGYRAYRILSHGKLAEITEEAVQSVMSSRDSDWNYLFIDRLRSAPNMTLSG